MIHGLYDCSVLFLPQHLSPPFPAINHFCGHVTLCHWRASHYCGMMVYNRFLVLGSLSHRAQCFFPSVGVEIKTILVVRVTPIF
jgi:hypothetical protein